MQFLVVSKDFLSKNLENDLKTTQKRILFFCLGINLSQVSENEKIEVFGEENNV